MRSTRARSLLAVAAMAFIAAACSGGSTTTSTESTSTTVATTTPPTTQPVATTAATTTTLATTTTTEPAGPIAPLTGLEVEAEITRPALLVKIDNHQSARPQRGVNAADVVYEELVEGNITRLAAIFHSQDADPIGPIRSARTGDFDLLTNLNRPLFANSGGNPTVMDLVRGIDAVLVSDANVGSRAFYRGGGKPAPHNLLSDTPTLYEAGEERGGGGIPPEMFSYRSDDDALPETAEDVDIVRIDYGGYRVEYQWDPEVSGWARKQQTTPHVDAEGVQIAPENVIVQFAEYGSSVAFAGSPEVRVVGTGDAWVLTQGRLIRATWSRPTEEALTEFRDLNGDIVLLTPGRTWVALPRPGTGFLIEG